MSENSLAIVSVPNYAIEEMGRDMWGVLQRHIMASEGFLAVRQNICSMHTEFVFDRPQEVTALPRQPSKDEQA